MEVIKLLLEATLFDLNIYQVVQDIGVDSLNLVGVLLEHPT